VADNRTTWPRTYSRETGKDWDELALVPSAPPYWATGMTQQQWLMQHDGQPVRLLLTAASMIIGGNCPTTCRLLPCGQVPAPERQRTMSAAEMRRGVGCCRA
jgi:hypothetical protein